MVLNLVGLDQVLTRHVVLVEVVVGAFSRWGFESPFTEEDVGHIRDARNQVRALLEDGLTEVTIREKPRKERG